MLSNLSGLRARAHWVWHKVFVGETVVDEATSRLRPGQEKYRQT